MIQAYSLTSRFERADAAALIGATVELTVWDGDERAVRATHRSAAVTGFLAGRDSDWLGISTAGCEFTDAGTGENLGSGPAQPELYIPFADIIQVG